jgi:hypothetical protein
MEPVGGSREGVGDGGGGGDGIAGVPNSFLKAVNGVVKVANNLLDGVVVLSPTSAGGGDGDLCCAAGDAGSSGTGLAGLGDLAASWTCLRRAIADSSPVMNSDLGSESSTLNESNSEFRGSASIVMSHSL